MRLRRRLVATMIILVALGLAAVDLITLSSLHSYLYGRIDDQLTTASSQTASFIERATTRGFAVTPTALDDRVSPDIYVELIGPGTSVISRPSSTTSQSDPPPELPTPLAPRPLQHRTREARVYRPSAASVNVPAQGGHGPEYRLQASTLPGQTLVMATNLDSVNTTLTSLRNIEVAVSLGLLLALLVLMALLIRLGLRPLEGMAHDADAIAAGDLSRRVEPTEGGGEIARLGRALNGMLDQIEGAFAQRARSEDRLRTFLADASHELRTPLTSIRGYAELLQKGALEDGPARQRALSRIEREAARMGVLVGDLGVLAREGEGPEPARERVDLGSVVSDAVADARATDPTRRIQLTVAGEVTVAGDDARLGQMIHNLLDNALIHTPQGTPVDVGVAARGGRAVLQVRDHGRGLSEEQASHVFDRFYRGDTERLDGGSGLGLSIVASLARTFGGGATVEPSEGGGALFEVVLPLYGDHPTENGGAAHANARDD
jgi:two-component system OmpR family sensor kinase